MCHDKGLSTRRKLATCAWFVVICMGLLVPAEAAQHARRKAKSPPLLPIPSGPTGPLPQIPLDSMAPVPPVVSYQNGQLTIVAVNSTLADILRAVHTQTGAEVDVVTANDRVVTQLGPAPARDVLRDLLAGSRFDYVLVGSATAAGMLTRVVLMEKSGANAAGAEAQRTTTQEAQIGQGVAAPLRAPEPGAPANPGMQTSQPPTMNQVAETPSERSKGTLESDEDEQ